MGNTLKSAIFLLTVVTVFSACAADGDDDGDPDDTPLLTGQWTWVSGAGTGEPRTAVYGTKGVPGPANVPGPWPGAVSWIDAGGKFWLFGGGCWEGGTNNINDLWRFDPTTLEWTWMSGGGIPNQPGVYGTKGVADPANVPGARHDAVSWADTQGRLWLFGGQEGCCDYFNDLWRFDPATSEWTWVSGSDIKDQPGVYGTKGVADPANIPGARSGAVSWTDDAGKFWLFGGETDYGGRLNDLWTYDPGNGRWTWMSGTDVLGDLGFRGTKGIADPANLPEARRGAAACLAPGGKLWLFGGNHVTNAMLNHLNDLWRLDLSTLEWTWVAGDSDYNSYGIYGKKGAAGPAVGPGARVGSAAWVDPDGRPWFFGGERGTLEYNDLWRYDPATGYWAWVAGSSSGGQAGIYGTKGTPSPANTPGARNGAVTWTDPSGKFWLFGGWYPVYGGSFNDLWHFTLD